MLSLAALAEVFRGTAGTAVVVVNRQSTLFVQDGRAFAARHGGADRYGATGCVQGSRTPT
eukprot:SAG11_NODE_1910_length_4079_cov_3.969095_4_plen_60_part_00